MPATALVSVIPLLLLASACVSVALLLLSLQRRNEELCRRMTTLEKTANAALADFQMRIDTLARRVSAAEDRPPVQAGQPRAGLTLASRAQALRMLHRGMNVENVAASLNLPRPEIELLIRIQQLSAASDGSTSEPPAG
ncbi:MAG TPA: hypothetical protein VMJ34_01745 [Bryobacteraceae bacterium]|nr:hypothetical protein [Bryobacteraceae bacterium]